VRQSKSANGDIRAWPSVKRRIRFQVKRLARAVIAAGLNMVERVLTGFWCIRQRRPGRRHHPQVGPPTRWFDHDEIVILDALSDVIIPTDETGPGARAAGVTAHLDCMVAMSPTLQSLYKRGLLGVDAVARRTYAVPFVSLTRDQQITLLEGLERLAFAVSATTPLVRRVRNVVRMCRAAANGSLAAAELFMRLVSDVKQIFYTSDTAWRWLGYDGPPMPQGYPNLAARPSGAAFGA
jgi:hypothetical protein